MGILFRQNAPPIPENRFFPAVRNGQDTYHAVRYEGSRSLSYHLQYKGKISGVFCVRPAQPFILFRSYVMSREIVVQFVQEGDVCTIHTGSPVLGDIVMDYSGYPEDARGGNSSILLLSAALSCYCGSIRAALVARDIPFRAIRATAKGIKRPNADGAMRLASIDISVAVEADEAYAEKVDHCAAIIKQCLITASLFEGIDVKHSVRRA